VFLDCPHQALRALTQKGDAHMTITNQILNVVGPAGQRLDMEPRLDRFGVRSRHLNSELVLTLGKNIARLPGVDPALSLK
jgi:hypothetical protein